jgi:hypothetical protein
MARTGDRRGFWIWMLVAVVVGSAKPAANVAAHSPAKPHGHLERAALARTLTPSAEAKGGIPGNYLALYRSAARRCPGLEWGVLAGIGKVETNHGRSRAPGVVSGVNSFGCCSGPMQFNIRNGPPSTWDAYGRGGNVYDPRDAIPAAARLLCANGARTDIRRAIFAYNHAGWYVDQVLTLARSYQAGGG